MNLGNAIKLCRTQRGFSLVELAQRADLSVSYLSLLERGKRDPSFSTIESIATALEVPVSILTFLAMDPEEVQELSPSLAEKLSLFALSLIRNSNEPLVSNL